MAWSTDIKLPKDVTPEFPDDCVVCQEPADSTAKITQSSQNWLLSYFVPLFYFLGWSRVEFPICAACTSRFFIQRWGRSLAYWVVIIAIVATLWPYFDDWGRQARRLAIFASGIALLMPLVIFEVIWPPYFDTTVGNNSVDYEFASEEYALQFFILNGEDVISSDFEADEDDDYEDEEHDA